MKWSIVTLIAVASGCTVLGLWAQEKQSPSFELPFSHQELMTYEMSLGLTNLGKALRPEPLTEVRDVHKIPECYGTMIDFTTEGLNAVLWFQDSQGVIRNAVITGVTERPIAIVREPVRKLEIKVIKGSK